MRLGFALAGGWIRYQPLILVGCADVVHFRETVGIEHRTTLRVRIKKPGDLRRIRIVQIRKSSTGSDGAVCRELISDFHVSGITEDACDRSDRREIRLLRRAGHRGSERELIEYVGE